MTEVRGKSLTPIAVVGMACRLPGGIDSPQMLWEALLRGDDLITEVPGDRWDVEEYFDPKRGVPGRSISRWGAFLDDPMGFDAGFFGLDEAKATAIDPQHRLLMETSWEAIEHAGIDPTSLAGSSTGVYLGISHDDHTSRALDAGVYGYTETSACMASGRVAYVLNVNGPALTFDTACSSSLVALHMAARGLASGETDLALAGGCMVMNEPRKNVWASAQGMLSPVGRCKAFDESADGFVRSEGTAMLLLKRLPDAVRDGDRILAVLRSTASNSDGRTRNIATPSLDAQVAATRAALAAADIDPDTIGAVEAHGTGTPVGDPIEFGSLAQTYGKTGTVLLGSAKSNLGHTEAAAGAVGVIKAILELQHGVVPPMVHFNRLPEKLAKIETGLTVPREVTAWPAGHGDVRRIAVASYGISGTNVHAILEQAPEAATPDESTASGPMVFALSSTSDEGIRATADRLADWVEENGDDVSLGDVVYTLARRRGHRPVRTGVIADSRSSLVEALRAVAGGEEQFPAAVGHGDRGPVWVFSGQGSQWASMGAELLASEPAFAAKIAELEPLIAAESDFSVTEAILAPETVTGIERIQPSIFAMQVAMAATMASYGITPGAIIGQSLGEVAAAVVAGALSTEDGVKVICRRSLLCRGLSGGGAMASIELPAQQVRAELQQQGIEDVTIAVIASPTSTVIGGAIDTVRRLVADWEQRDVMAREIAVDVASHTPHVQPVTDELFAWLGDITPMTPEVPYYSATLFDAREQPYCDAEYWVDNLRHTVRFSAAVQTAMEDGFRVFAELSPHPLVVRAIGQIGAVLEMPVVALAGMRRGQELPYGLRGLVSDLYAAGAAVDVAGNLPDGRFVEVPLSAWTHRKLMLEVPNADQARGGHLVAAHPLLGSHVRLLDAPRRDVWQAEVGIAALPWLGDHQVEDVPTMPTAAYCEMALAAARATIGDVAEVWDVRFERALKVENETSLNATASAQADDAFDFVVETGQDGERERRATAVLHAVDNPDDDRPAAYDIAELIASHPVRAEGADLRTWFAARGVKLGPAFSALTAVQVSDGTDSTMVAELAVPSALRNQQSSYGVHPAVLDACFQSIAAHSGVRAAGGQLLPLGVRRLRAYGPAGKARYCVTRMIQLDGPAFEADIHLVDAHGVVLLAVEGLSMSTGPSDKNRTLNERLLTVEWSKHKLPALADDVNPGAWLLVNTSDSTDLLASELADSLKLNNADVTMMSWSQQADHVAAAAQLTTYLTENSFGSVVVVSAPRNGFPPEQVVYRGAEHVRHLVRITRELAETAGEPRLYVLTRGAQMVCNGDRPNLEQAGLRGLVRVIGAEHPHLRPSLIDVDENTLGRSVAHQMLLGSEADETAFRKDEWFTARLVQAPLRDDERYTAVVDHERDGMRLEIRTPGDLDSLQLSAFQRTAPGAGEIEVAVTATSVNYADVLVAMDRCASAALGSDFAGVVTAVGAGVTSHRVGDHVGGITPNGSWGTFVTCNADLAVTLPRGLRDDQAAAVSTASATAWYGLQELARIKAGDKVLIHSATGGVGRAAIAIARLAGAEIFATAGTQERRELLRSMGIKHVYDSRTLAFAEQIRRDTDGYGVDIVLNSLAGAAQKAGMELLAFGGRFVEIGKEDTNADAPMGLSPFRRNLSFYGVDMELMCSTHPTQVRELLNNVYRLTAKGVLPQPDATHYPLAEAARAIRAMDAGEHSGKLILSVPRVGYSTVVVPPEQARVFRRDGSYIVTGGLGGLGLFLAGKMAESGCGRIILNSRSAAKPAAVAEIERMRALGVEIEVVTGDIAIAGTVDRLVAEATSTGLPVRGVLHAAAVVEDATLTNISDELVERDWAPKVYGAWHLHRATATQPLDWFCSFSSAAALIGSAGQGAYAAANSWLDAFTHWRRAQGLPANAVAWAAWDEIGAGKHLAASTTAMIDPEEGAYAFEALLRHNRAYAGYSPVVGAPWLADLASRSAFGEEFAASATLSDDCSFRTELHALPRDEWASRVRRLVAEQLGQILRSSVDPDRPITEYGLDSLGNLELRTRIEAETGIRIRSMDITTVRALADTLCESLIGVLATAR